MSPKSRRFDLAPILGRRSDGFSPTHPLLSDISNLDSLADKKLIAEPWDPGPGGYQLGNFPPRWAEWNDKYRDNVRQFWRGDENTSGLLATRLHGSADIFEASRRRSPASINFVAVHDGFTLRDTVSYEHRHNEANGEDNRDGHSHNYSHNHGVEGDTDDEAINRTRRQQRLNIMATLLFSQGTPLILAGDEIGHTQGGNNNAYAQDNEIGWLDWSGLDEDPEFLDEVRELVWLRRENSLLRIEDYVHGSLERSDSLVEIHWINKEGEIKQSEEWAGSRAFSVLIEEKFGDGGYSAVAIFINRYDETTRLLLPKNAEKSSWHVAFSSAAEKTDMLDGHAVNVPALSVALLRTD